MFICSEIFVDAKEIYFLYFLLLEISDTWVLNTMSNTYLTTTTTQVKLVAIYSVQWFSRKISCLVWILRLALASDYSSLRPTLTRLSRLKENTISWRLPTSFGLNWTTCTTTTCGFDRTMQQDNIDHVTYYILHERFDGMVIFHGGDVNCTLRSWTS